MLGSGGVKRQETELVKEQAHILIGKKLQGSQGRNCDEKRWPGVLRTMDVRGRIIAGTVLLAGAVVTGIFGMMIQEETLQEVNSYITSVIYKEEALENSPKIALTFDDGPSGNTGEILDILAEYDVKATFFVVGKEEEKYQPLYKRIVEEGHTLAMHSYSHKYNEIYQSKESYVEDLTKLQEFLYDTTGVWCRYCRFPGGSSNTVSRVDMHELIAYLEEQDMSYFDWNVSSGDATSAYISPEAIIRNSTARLQEFQEAIILMHDASDKDSTVKALPGLIERIQAMEDTKIVPITDDTEAIHHISND